MLLSPEARRCQRPLNLGMRRVSVERKSVRSAVRLNPGVLLEHATTWYTSNTPQPTVDTMVPHTAPSDSQNAPNERSALQFGKASRFPPGHSPSAISIRHRPQANPLSHSAQSINGVNDGTKEGLELGAGLGSFDGDPVGNKVGRVLGNQDGTSDR